jgi:hypothetical protein
MDASNAGGDVRRLGLRAEGRGGLSMPLASPAEPGLEMLRDWHRRR